MILFLSIPVISAKETTNSSIINIELEIPNNSDNLNKGYDKSIKSEDNSNTNNLNIEYNSSTNSKDNSNTNNLNIEYNSSTNSKDNDNTDLKNTYIQIISQENWIVYGEGETYKIKLMDEEDTPLNQSRIYFKIKKPDNTYINYDCFTDELGIASFSLNLDILGVYTIQSCFNGNSEYAPAESVNSSVILYKRTVIKILKQYAYRGDNFIIKLVTNNNKALINQKVKIIIDKITYIKTTDSNGLVSVKMPSNVKSVMLTCIFNSIDYYATSEFSIRLPVYKKTSVKPLIFSILKGKNFKILLKGIDGKILTKQKIKFTINGISYIRYTNSKGIAYLKINLKRNEYTIFFEYNNNTIYGPSSGSSNLNVIDPSGQFKYGLNQNTKSSVKKYLHGGSYAKITKSIKALAKTITRKYSTKFEKVVAIYNYVRDTLNYSFYLNSRKGASKTLKTKSGNCCDHASLIVALCRASKLPARYSHSKRCRFNSGHVVGHVWAQIYVGGRWYSADATSYKNSLGHISNWDTKHYKGMNTYKNIPF